jgi:hypothetical protein
MSLYYYQQFQVTCGGELAVLFVETLITGEFPYSEQIFGQFSYFIKQHST